MFHTLVAVKKNKLRKRDQICGCDKKGVEGGGAGGRWSKEQTSSYN